MTREQAIHRLISSGFTENQVSEIVRALTYEPTTKNDLALIHTEGLDEEIRCTMCTNSMKSDRGCDGNCVVDKDMYKAVMDAIEKRIQLTPKNDLGVDYRSLEDIKKLVERKADDLDGVMLDAGGVIIGLYFAIANDLPSVTPQEPRCKECKWWKDSDGEYRRGWRAESHCPINTHDVYRGEGYCYMFSPKINMREVEG